MIKKQSQNCHPERKEPLALSEVEGEGSGQQK